LCRPPTARQFESMHKIAFISGLVAVAICTTALARANPSGSLPTKAVSPPPGLTRSGIHVWQFEALLRDVFGSRTPYASSASFDTNFACAGSSCYPHAKWDRYGFTFANAHGSTFQLKSRVFPQGAFGNYPLPLRINGLHIVCNQKATMYLVVIKGAAGFPLACVNPG
jgi:hypothetical protein